jgi:hypothetical protein
MTSAHPFESGGTADQDGLRDLFQRVVDLAKLTFPEVVDVSVTMVQGKDVHTSASTGALALALDELQYRLGYGPCLLAASAITIESVSDMATETRWPDWTAAALKAGARSSLSIAMPLHGGAGGAINLYATTANAFDEDDVAVAQTLAGYASLATTNAYVDNAKTMLSRHIHAVTDSASVVELAKGLTMADRQCTAEQAFAILTTTARDTNRTVQEVAQSLVDEATGTHE